MGGACARRQVKSRAIRREKPQRAVGTNPRIESNMSPVFNENYIVHVYRASFGVFFKFLIVIFIVDQLRA